MAENYNKEVGKLIKINCSSSHNQETIQHNKANGITGLEEKIKGNDLEQLQFNIQNNCNEE